MSQTIVLTCPNCATRFSAPADKFLPNGRQVRCSQCQHMWFHAAPTGSRVATAAASGAPGAAVARPAIRETLAGRRRDRGAGLFTWLLWAIALFLLAAILAYVFREPLRRAAPRAAPWLDRYVRTVDHTAQGLIGRTELRSPLQLKNIHYDVNEYDGEKAILVEADLANTGGEDLPAPKVHVRIVDADSDPMLAAIVGPEDMSETIAAGATTRYFVRIPEPPAEFDRVLLNIEE